MTENESMTKVEKRETDFRWLIEAPGRKYLAIQRLSGSNNFKWTEDHNDALAFRSEEQANALMMAVRQWNEVICGGPYLGLFGFEVTLGNAKAVEHGFISAALTAAKGGGNE
jgi:hypothetical protein